VERTTRITVLVQFPHRDVYAVTAGLSREMGQLHEHIRRSRTWDRGMALDDHRTVTANTGLEVYFAGPRILLQRGTNENTKRLLWQYFPKGTSMGAQTRDGLNAVAATLNERPRKTFDFDTPSYRFDTLLR
jgi:IS30 family transposase